MRNNRKINLEYVSEVISVDKENGKTKVVVTFNSHLKEFAELYGRPSDVILSEQPKKCAGLKEALEGGTFTATGVAACSKDDVYDEERGIEIARQRARFKAEKKYNRWTFIYAKLMRRTFKSILKANGHSDDALARYHEFENKLKNEL